MRSDGPREPEVSITAADKARGIGFRNDLLEGGATTGGNIVPRSFVGRYDYLEAFSGIRRVATILTTSGGENLDLPKVTAHGAAAIVGEGTALAEADPAFGKVTLGSWKYAQLVQISTELVTDSGVMFSASSPRTPVARSAGSAATPTSTEAAPTSPPGCCMWPARLSSEAPQPRVPPRVTSSSTCTTTSTRSTGRHPVVCG